MSKGFLLVWILFSGIMISLSIRFYFATYQGLGLMFALQSVFGMFMVYQIVSKHKQFRLNDDKLTIRQMFRPVKELSLKQLTSWKEDDFIFRGQVNRKLILKTKKGDKVSLSDKDDLEEFEKLVHHLRVNQSDIRE